MSKKKEVRKIDRKMSNLELLDELIKKEVSGRYKLGHESRAIIMRMEPGRLIILSRAETDVKSPYVRLSERVPEASGKAIEEIVLALKTAGFIIDEPREYSLIRKFLAEEVFGELYGSVKEYESRVPYSDERIAAFYDIVGDVLTDEEYELVIDIMNDDFDFDNHEDYARAEWLYSLAISKLIGDCREVNYLLGTAEADLYLASDREKHITEREILVYKNAYKDLRRVYNGKHKPYRVCPWRLK